jgi:hypothetical protein
MDIVKYEWKGLLIVSFVVALAGAFIATALRPPWNDAVLAAVAHEQGNDGPARAPQPKGLVAKE